VVRERDGDENCRFGVKNDNDSCSDVKNALVQSLTGGLWVDLKGGD
jgi:hypothetical protein